LWAMAEKIYAPAKGSWEVSGLGLRPIIRSKKKPRRKKKWEKDHQQEWWELEQVI